MSAELGFDLQSFSPTIRPQDDFFRYVHGPWLDSHVIPPDRAADGSFHRLRDLSEERVHGIITAADPASTIGALFQSFMDEARLQEIGTTSLGPDLEFVDAATDKTALASAIGKLQRVGVGGLVGYYVHADQKNPTQNVVYLTQSGISLPDEAYYREEQHAEIRTAFVTHVNRMAELAGLDFRGEDILRLETSLAAHHWDVVKSREADLTYNPISLAELAQLNFPWREWAAAIELPEAATELLIAQELGFFQELGTVWEEFSLADWQAWVRWRILQSRAAYLTPEISRANFDFYGTVLSGAPEQRERWKRGVAFVETLAGELVGQEYVKQFFPPEYKAQMDELVENLIQAYREAIAELDWMSPETKEKALTKLTQFTPKIGYPEKWRDFSGLTASADDLVGNYRTAARFHEDYDWQKIGKPVDKSEWLMTPQTVNAYYLPTGNEIAFPAAILQPPFFDPHVDAAINYGAIGSVIGHEIGHGFDDQGSKYDGTGALSDWWTEADRQRFEERAAKLIEQYNGYSPKQLGPEHKVNGALTVGENIGDLAGVSISLRAYQLHLGGDLTNAPVIAGLTGLQRFFLAYAYAEQTKRRDEALITQIATDPHSPEEFRINGVVRNIDAWYEAFDVQPGDELYLDPSDRVRIW